MDFKFSLTQSQIDDFCESKGYEETVANEDNEEVSNPQSKEDFVNVMIGNFLNDSINRVRHEKAQASISYTEAKIKPKTLTQAK